MVKSQKTLKKKFGYWWQHPDDAARSLYEKGHCTNSNFPNWKLILERKTIKLVIRDEKKTEFKDSNPNYKRWPLIISRVIRIACILIKTLIPHKYSFEFCLGSWTMKILPSGEMRIFSIYMATLKWTYPRFGTHGSALGFWKLDILHENPEILTDF